MDATMGMETKKMETTITAAATEMIASKDSILSNVLPRLERIEMEKSLKDNGVSCHVWEGMNMIVRYYIPLNVEDQVRASVQVSNKLLEMSGIDEQELFDAAVRNAGECTQIHEMADILRALTGDPFGDNTGLPMMYVLTNDSGMYGAAQILSRDALREVAKMIGSTFYIIPSSVHEVITLPLGDADADAIIGMIKDVNDTVVEDKDRLSYAVYIYDNGEITMKGGD